MIPVELYRLVEQRRDSSEQTMSKDSFRQRIYCAARDGLAITLFALLNSKPKSEYSEYLDSVVSKDGQKCTPFIIAARNGRIRVIQMLLDLEGYKVNLEQEGTVQFDGYVIDGATALWCAAGAGHERVVEALVLHGADVNHPTRTMSTPLRAACFEGRLDIAQFLLDHNADLHIANKYNNTCLMIAAYKGHVDVVRYLLSKGADPNVQAHCGATALQFAAEHGHLEIVKELLKSNAHAIRNGIGMTPLLAAAERTKSEMVEYLIEQPWCTREAKIEALELLGASYANDKDNYSLEKAYSFLERAMIERCRPPVVPKQLTAPIPAYDNRVECLTLQELERIRDDAHALHMESLVIRERILGPQNPEVPHPVIFRGAVFADSAAFDRCLQLWLHALRLRAGSWLPLRKDLLRFAQVFSQMSHVGVEVPPFAVIPIMSAALKELEAGGEDLEANLYTALYLLVIVTKLHFSSAEEEHEIHKLVYKLVRLKRTTKDGSTLLHLCVNSDTPVDDFHTKNVCHFPCASTAKLLLQCGADPNAVNSARNTPLHVIVGYQKPISDFLTLHAIITGLVEAGAHCDSTNARGESALEASTTGVAEIILRTQTQIRLKCLAARAVSRYELPYRDGEVPTGLIGFIQMHGGRCREPHIGAD